VHARVRNVLHVNRNVPVSRRQWTFILLSFNLS
jgi:hypothetical protein